MLWARQSQAENRGPCLRQSEKGSDPSRQGGQTPFRTRRRGVILLVVVSLLTLFALIGLSFVLYAESQANSSRIYREAGQYGSGPPDIPYDQLMNYFLSQFVFGVDNDPSGVQSTLRGHNLSSLMYGSNPQILNNNAFNGGG